MWPEIYRKNNVGVIFDPDFWRNWGPTHMVYFHPDLFSDDKKINSIYCLWQPFTTIDFNKEDIAMVLEYACVNSVNIVPFFRTKIFRILNIQDVKIIMFYPHLKL